ncbi:MAG: hypothetical protein KJ592_04330 [Nanoarchaeota archaeon]|nr:hypothetical protein [Nanoarchaeota archaeon]
MQLLLILSFAFLLGFISKTADLLNEHGLKWFKHIDTFLGLIWGSMGAYLVYIDPNLATVYITTVLYWFIRIKLDYPNHAIAGVIISLTTLWVAKYNPNFSWYYTFWLFLWLTISGYINTYLKDHYEINNPSLKSFLRLRLRYYAGPLVFSLIISNYLPFIATILGMLGTEIVTIWFDKYEKTGRSNIAKTLGMHLETPKYGPAWK